MDAPKSPTTRVFVASRNRHKLREISAILGPQVCCVGMQGFPNAPVTVEDRPTFTGNAAKKASELAEWLSLHFRNGQLHDPRHSDIPPDTGAFAKQFVLADDSGLEVDALNGAPGVHSARFAALDSEDPAQNSSDLANNRKLLKLLERVPHDKRRARFRCVLAILELAPSGALPATKIFEGACEGHIEFAPRGARGFGYDPLFVPEGYEQSFAELGEDVKNRISHRAKALQKLREWLQQSR